MPLIKRAPQGTTVESPRAEQAKQPEMGLKSANPARLTSHKSTADGGAMSKAEWAAKDRRISRQGLFQAALQSVGVLQLNVENTFEGYMALVEKVAEHGLTFVSKE
jgi:hypothetical protein